MRATCIILVLALVSLWFTATLSDCSSLLSSDTIYTSNQSITLTSGTICLNVSASNVTIDCNGYPIIGNELNTGIFSAYNNTLIKNCNISRFSTAIELRGSTDTVKDSSITNLFFGGKGILIQSGGTNATVRNVNISSTESPIVVYGGSDDMFAYLNVFSDTSFYAVKLETTYRTTIRDSLINATGTSALDVEQGGNDSIINSTVFSPYDAMFVYYHDGLNVSNDSLYSNYSSCVDEYYSNYLDATNVSCFTFYGPGVYIRNSNNNFVTNSTIRSQNGTALKLLISSGNTALRNNFTAPVWVNDYGGSNNSYNDSSAGNAYYFPNGTGSWKVYNITHYHLNNYADRGTDRPFSQATVSPYFYYNAQDWHPFTLVSGPAWDVAFVRISPAHPSASDTLSCIVQFAADSNANLSVEWYQNGTNRTDLAGTYTGIVPDSPTTVSTVPTLNLKTNDSWYCRAKLFVPGNTSGWIDSQVVVISPCGINISLAGTTYTFNENASVSGRDCIRVYAENVTIDCQGQVITGDGNYNFVYTNSSNTTVRNCIVEKVNAGVYLDGASHGTVINNTVSDSYEGTYANGAYWNNLTRNFFNSNNYAVYLDKNSDDNSITNNTAFNNSFSGFFFNSNSNNSLEDDKAYGNNGDGIHIDNASGSSLSNTTLYNNGYDLYADGSSGSFFYNMTDTKFLNPSGTLENYTSLNIDDAVNNGEGYYVNWSTNTSALPANASSFIQKFVTIASIAETPSIDSITWSWQASELNASYNELQFDIWRYDGAWASLGANLGDHALTAADLVPGGVYGVLQSNSTLRPQPQPIILHSSSSGPVEKIVSWATEFNCSSGELAAFASDNNAGITLKLFGVSNTYTETERSDQNGKAVFNVSINGIYRIYQPSSSGYRPYTSDPFNLTMCPPASPKPLNNTPPYNHPDQNASVSGPPSNRTTNTTGQNTSQIPSGPTQQDAANAISSATSAISDAVRAGKGISAAQSMLDAAKTALAAGDYADAIKFAEEAQKLALNAGASSIPSPPASAISASPSPSGNTWLLLGGIIIVIVLVLSGTAAFLLSKWKRK